MSSKATMTDGLLATGFGAVLFIAFYLFLDMGLVLSLIVLGGGFVAGLFLFTRDKPKEVVAEDDLKSAIEAGTLKLVEIKKFEKKIKKASAIQKLREIEIIVQKILDDLVKDPGDLKAAQQFLNFYLDSTIKILNRYVELSDQNVDDPAINASLAKVESMLSTLKDAFEKQLGKLLTNDVMDLDTELSLLDSTIKMEGLGK